MLNLVGERFYLTAVEREVGSHCPVEIFGFEYVLCQGGFDTVVFHATLVASLQNLTCSGRNAHCHYLIVDSGRVVSHIEASAISEESQVGTYFPRFGHFGLEVESLAHGRVVAPAAIGECRPVLECVGEFIWCAALTHLSPVASYFTIREYVALNLEQFGENQAGGNRRIEVSAVYLTKGRRTVETTCHRHLSYAAIVETQFAEVAELIPIGVSEIEVVVRRRRVGECGRVDVLEAVEVAFEHKALTG